MSSTPTFDSGLLAKLLNLLPNLYFYVHDYDMRLVYVNKAAAEQYKLGKEELVGRVLCEIEAASERKFHFSSVCRGIMEGGRPHVTGEPVAARLADGSTAYYRRHDIPFRHPDTGQLMLMGIALDATHEVEHQRQREKVAVLHREMQIAQEIQGSLRPERVDSPDVELCGRSAAAAYAGGDFYDWQRAPEGSIVIALGDVAGHGVGPALLAATCRAYWRVLGPAVPLREAVIRLNELLRADLAQGRFVTLAAARIWPGGAMELFSAGHGPLLVRRSDGRVERVEAHAPPVGLFEIDTVGECTRHQLDEGDALLLVSDGVTDVRDPAGLRWGHEALLGAVASACDPTAEALLEAVDRANLEFAAGVAPDDDRTMVVAARALGRGVHRVVSGA